MTTSAEVCSAIAEAVAELWPERMIYRDFCPVGHHRPSSYLYVTESRMTPVNLAIVEWQMEARLELFCATDDYDISSTEELRQEQEKVLLAFSAPSIRVGDRWITLTARGDGMEMGSAFVIFSAKWFDGNPGYQGPESASIPKMQQAEVRVGTGGDQTMKIER